MFKLSRRFGSFSSALILALAACDDSEPSQGVGDELLDAASGDERDVDSAFPSGNSSSGDGTADASVVETSDASDAQAGAHLFDETRVATLVIEVSASDLEQLRSDADLPMGTEEFTYVPARITYDDVALDEVGIRVKGNSSRMSAIGNAVPFKLDTNRYVKGQKLDGLAKVNLHNDANQPSLMNEYLSYGALRDFGIAASRTGWVDVTLNGEFLGTYVVVEQVDDELLSRYYEDGDADLYKPEPPTGYLTYDGSDFESYSCANYEAKNETDHRTFLELITTINERAPSEWDQVIDVDSVLDYFAANVGLGNWDTYVAMGHNYYLFEATPGRMVMLPWDMNLSQAATTAVCPRDLMGEGILPGGDLAGTGEGAPFPGGGGMLPPGLDAAALDGGLFLPPDGSGFALPDGGLPPGGAFGAGGQAPLHDKLLADPVYLARYLQRLRAFVEGAGSYESLTHRLDVGAAALGERITEQSVTDLRRAVATRVTALAEAIDSTTSCNTAAATGGPGGVRPQ